MEDAQKQAVGGDFEIRQVPPRSGGPSRWKSTLARNPESQKSRHFETIFRILNERRSPVHVREFVHAGVEPSSLRSLVYDGAITNPMHGVYYLAEAYDPFLMAIAGLSTLSNDFVVGLKSAAQYHGLITKPDDNLWIAIPYGKSAVKAAGDYRTVAVRWQNMMPPTEPMVVSEIGDGMVDHWVTAPRDDMEATERYFGFSTEVLFGRECLITTPSKTVCDMLRNMNRLVGKDMSFARYISEGDAFDALKSYSERYDLMDLRRMADRHGCLPDIERHISLAERFAVGLRR
ncbi:MAG: hypothetical protein OJJ21_22120 [Ferrovibrio sp.]|uniref:type IV toxin-antitoxin system AbiEi family antitoxin domain-containing protein n=1 Tax=Ferrovibrio sp. TaxID=1917215 RepID=UPI002638039D|nr:hypothetical protein [Ferrovibrio sp.]MCW0236310.1 hypothetical protein [Ferrovibrio sp.]